MKKYRFLYIFLMMFVLSKDITYAATIEKVKSNYDSSIQYQVQLDGKAQEKSNCGPAVLKMVMSIFDDKNEVSYEEIRKVTRNHSKGMYASEIKKALEIYEVPYKEKTYIDSGQLIEIIDNGDVAILCIDMSKIGHVKCQDNFKGKNTEALNTGHYVLLTGYRYEEGKAYFEVLDPYNKKIGTNYIYSPISYYEEECLEKAIKNWYTNVLIIDK